MNSSWAALAGEAVGSDCSESAGHVGAHLGMPLLPLHGEGDHLDLLVPLLLLPVGRVLHVLVVGALVHGGHPALPIGLVNLVLLVSALVLGRHPVEGLLLLAVRQNSHHRIQSVQWRYLVGVHVHGGHPVVGQWLLAVR
jgi:hypothetical protein